jgi:hypothetical protein
MIVSEVVRQLSQFPHRFPLHVEQGGVIHEILAAEYSHEPARAVLKIAEAEVTPEVRAKVEAAFTKWWHNEGSALRRDGEEDIEEFVARATRIAWMNGAYVRRHASEFPAPLPEPEATIAELRGEVPPAPVPFTIGEILAEVLPPEEPTPTIAEQVIAETPTAVAADPKQAAGRSTRKPKTAPFGTA